MPAEARLQGREALVLRQAFDGHDLAALGLHGQYQAAAHGLAVEEQRAGSANPMLAADMRARKPQVMAKAIRERQARLDRNLDFASVHFEANLHGLSRRHLECALDHGAGKRLAVGAAGMNVAVRIEGGRGRSLSLGDNGSVDRRSVKHSLDGWQPQRPVGYTDHADMRIRSLAAVVVIEEGRCRERKIAATTRKFLKAPASSGRPDRQANFDDDLVAAERCGQRSLEEIASLDDARAGLAG